jgi:glycerophosphoryl diester phosphodiesterase
MRRYRTSDAPWTAGFDPYKYQNSIPRAIAAAGGLFWGPYYPDATVATVRQAHQEGLSVSVWTANTEQEFANLIAASVDVITTDYPDRLLDFLASL